MAGTYQHASDWIPGYPPYSGVIRVADGKFIACAAGSQDWQDYLTWAAADVANVPDPFLSPNAGGVAIVPVEGEVPYGSMLESIPAADPALGPPVMVDLPAVTGPGDAVVAGANPGDTLNCTMGNWNGAPTRYEGRWMSDAPADLSAGASYVLANTDSNHTVVCIVTATNQYGSTTSPPSNGVLVADMPGDLPGTEAASRTVPPPKPEPKEVEEHEEEHRTARQERAHERAQERNHRR